LNILITCRSLSPGWVRFVDSLNEPCIEFFLTHNYGDRKPQRHHNSTEARNEPAKGPMQTQMSCADEQGLDDKQGQPRCAAPWTHRRSGRAIAGWRRLVLIVRLKP